MLLKHLESLIEARLPELTYTEKSVKDKLDKVIVELSGAQSGKFTKLAGKYAIIKKQVEDLAEVQNGLNAEIKAASIDLFNAEDEVLTRVVETLSMTINISKLQKSSISKTDYTKVIEGIISLVPELEEKINKLIEVFTEIKESEKSPALRVSLKEGILDWLKKASAKFKKIFTSFSTWGTAYDKKLLKIKDETDKIGLSVTLK